MSKKVVKFMTREEREFKYLWDNTDVETRKYALAFVIIKHNAKDIAEAIYGKKLNDIEFQKIKNYLKQYL